ncbi:unnamed protein product, partial [Chrysoparadoxa australica]
DIEVNLGGDIIRLHTTHSQVEELLKTQMNWHKSTLIGATDQLHLRAVEAISVPDHLESLISFTSANSPIHVYKRTPKSKISKSNGRRLRSKDRRDNYSHMIPQLGRVEVMEGNDGVLIGFKLDTLLPRPLNHLAVTVWLQRYDDAGVAPLYPPVVYNLP